MWSSIEKKPTAKKRRAAKPVTEDICESSDETPPEGLNLIDTGPTPSNGDEDDSDSDKDDTEYEDDEEENDEEENSDGPPQLRGVDEEENSDGPPQLRGVSTSGSSEESDQDGSVHVSLCSFRRVLI